MSRTFGDGAAGLFGHAALGTFAGAARNWRMFVLVALPGQPDRLARLEHDDIDTRLGEPASEDRAGDPGADDDDVT